MLPALLISLLVIIFHGAHTTLSGHPLFTLMFCLLDHQRLRPSTIQYLPPWSRLEAYPAHWCLFSSVMLNLHAAMSFWCGEYYQPPFRPRKQRQITTATELTALFGLGPKPGTWIPWINNAPSALRRHTIRALKRVLLFPVRSAEWLIDVGGLLTLILFWYCCAAFDMLHLFELESPTYSPYSERIPVACQQRELCNDYFSLSSDLKCTGEAMNAHRTRQSFDPAFIANLLSNRGLNANLFEIILDTGCTFAITPFRSDFIEYSEGTFGNVNTVSGPTSIVGFGHVEWTVVSENGNETVITVPCHHVPAATVRLLSPQDYCLYHGFDRSRDQFAGNSSYFWMHLYDNENRFQCPMDPRTSLPIALAYCRTPPEPSKQREKQAKQSKTSRKQGECQCHTCTSCNLTVADETNQNITSAQKELLLWHWRLAHMGFDHLQKLLRTPSDLPDESNPSPSSPTPAQCLHSKNVATATCSAPKCAACEIARAKRRNPNVSTSHKTRVDVLRTENLLPGQRISVDQYESAVRGRIRSSRGRESFGQKYGGGTIFCDHASGYVQAHHQVSLRASDTIRSKRKFERDIRSCGVTVEEYHGDNGIFRAKEFREELMKHGQSIDFSGVGAQHQNGVAERNIRTVTEMARAMMQHAHMHWPDQFSQDLWPFALDYACWIHNRKPQRDSGIAPTELFCGVKGACRQLLRTRVWGSPGFILDPKLQDGKKIPKWQPRAREGQFMGFSLEHSSTVGLFRNLRTQSVTPQFHVVFDELFTTVLNVHSPDELWIELFMNEREYYGPDDDEEEDDAFPLPPVNNEWLPLDEQPIQEIVVPEGGVLNDRTEFPTPVPRTRDDIPDDLSEIDEDLPVPEDTTEDEAVQTTLETTLDPTREEQFGRGKRNKKQPERWTYGGNGNFVTPTPNSRIFMGLLNQVLPDDVGLFMLDWTQPYSREYGIFHVYDDLGTDPDTDETDWMHPFALAAKATSVDSPTYREILTMGEEEREKWFIAMEAELTALLEKETFTVIDRSSVPLISGSDRQQHQIVKSTWVLKRKRRPDGMITKLKARFCVRGDIQQLADNETTYAPVVDWGTVRLLFTLSVAHNLPTKQIDFRNAFVQSRLPEPIYLELPQGFDETGKVFKVDKSLYGDKRAPKLWFEHLRDNMICSQLGFTQSEADPCLFVKEGIAFITYVDDGIFVAKDTRLIDESIALLRQRGLDLDEEDDYAGYLGIDLQRQPDGSIHLLQTGLIERIIADLDLTDSPKTKETPSAGPLGACKDSLPLRVPWNYRSVIGKLFYVGNNTRSDIAFANHQCARFSSDPRVPHGMAVKRIAMYLKKTLNQGTVIRPNNKELTLDCYCDADFAGLFAVEDPEDPRCTRSRTGFVITLGGTPVIWASRLQTETALSTMEAEYIALSTAMRSLLPLRHTLQELVAALSLSQDQKSVIHSTIWEDNAAALILANSDPPRLTKRSKHIHVKYHWFKSHLVAGLIEIKPIDTKNQLADFLTKSLPIALLAPFREKLMGWLPV
jgi:hypothetical protein